MSRQHVREQPTPAGEAGAKNDLDRLPVDSRDAAHVVDDLWLWNGLRAPFRARVTCAWWVKTKSEALIGTPSLHLASGRMRYVSVYGGSVVCIDVRDEALPIRVVGADLECRRENLLGEDGRPGYPGPETRG